MTGQPLAETDFELRTDHNITSRGIASMGDIESLHNVTDDSHTGKGVTVVVMDSGIDTSHPIFSDGQVIERVDKTGTSGGTLDAVGHGTATAGLIAEIAPDVELIDLRIFGDEGRTSGQVVYDAYRWLIQNRDKYDIVNMSWGASKKVQKIDDLHNKLHQSDVHTVVAAGNTGAAGGSPSTATEAFSTAAVDEQGNLTRFSSYNPQHDNPDVAAIGKDVRLARASGTSMGQPIDEHWTKASGTSFSAPIVAGFLVQLIEKHGASINVEDLFESTARDIEGTTHEGAGIADYKRVLATSVEKEKQKEEQASNPTAEADAWRFNDNDVVYIDANWLPDAELTAVKLDESDGSITVRFDEK